MFTIDDIDVHISSTPPFATTTCLRALLSFHLYTNASSLKLRHVDLGLYLDGIPVHHRVKTFESAYIKIQKISLRGNMIQLFNIVSGMHTTNPTVDFNFSYVFNTRDNILYIINCSLAFYFEYLLHCSIYFLYYLFVLCTLCTNKDNINNNKSI